MITLRRADPVREWDRAEFLRHQAQHWLTLYRRVTDGLTPDDEAAWHYSLLVRNTANDALRALRKELGYPVQPEDQHNS